MPLHTASIYTLHSMLATVQTRVQRAAMLVSKREAMPESDPVRPHLIWLASLALARHQAAQRLLSQKIKEAETKEAEQAAVADPKAEIIRPKDAQDLEDARREARVAHELLQRSMADRTSALARLDECRASVIRHRQGAAEAEAKLRIAERHAGL